jgi:hypothetical protein
MTFALSNYTPWVFVPMRSARSSVMGRSSCGEWYHKVENVTVYNQFMDATKHLSYLWDYDLDSTQFQEILEGRRTNGRLNQDWAARRLLEYASYEEIVRLIGFKRLVDNWPRWRGKIRSKSRVRGFDFLVKWLPEKHPELLHG